VTAAAAAADDDDDGAEASAASAAAILSSLHKWRRQATSCLSVMAAIDVMNVDSINTNLAM